MKSLRWLWKRKYLVLMGAFGVLCLFELSLRYFWGLGNPPLLDKDPRIGYVFRPGQDLYRFGNRVVINRFSQRSDDTDDSRRARLGIVQRVVELEKPAHTVFDVKFYWALFRLGEARLGDDTLVDRGGRAPDLLPPLRLGEGHLAESRLAAGHPQNVSDRLIVGRDGVGGNRREETRG